MTMEIISGYVECRLALVHQCHSGFDNGFIYLAHEQCGRKSEVKIEIPGDRHHSITVHHMLGTDKLSSTALY